MSRGGWGQLLCESRGAQRRRWVVDYFSVSVLFPMTSPQWEDSTTRRCCSQRCAPSVCHPPPFLGRHSNLAPHRFLAFAHNFLQRDTSVVTPSSSRCPISTSTYLYTPYNLSTDIPSNSLVVQFQVVSSIDHDAQSTNTHFTFHVPPSSSASFSHPRTFIDHYLLCFTFSSSLSVICVLFKISGFPRHPFLINHLTLFALSLLLLFLLLHTYICLFSHLHRIFLI